LTNFNFIIDNRIIEITAETLEQAEVLAKIISDELELEKKQE